MDPLSVIASVIAISGAVATSLEQVRQFYGAEAEVLSLVNEVNDLHLVLTQFHRTIRECGQTLHIQEDCALAIASVVKRAQADFEELNHAINKGVFRSDPTVGKNKIGRFSWMRQKSKLQRLSSQLKDARMTLTSLCSSATLYVLASKILQGFE